MSESLIPGVTDPAETSRSIGDAVLKRLQDAEAEVEALRSQLAQAEAETQHARRNVEVLTRELDEARQSFPCDGVWLVRSTPDVRESCVISQLGELPDPIEFATIAQHTRAIARAVSECWELYYQRGHQSPMDVAEAIVKRLYRVMRERA